MALIFSELQSEVKRRATKDQGGSSFDVPVKNAINASIKRIAREALWRQLRRETTFDTETSYVKGSGGGTFTKDSKNVTIVGATFVTDGIQIGRFISLQGSSKLFTIKTITSETVLTIDQNYSGTTISGTGTYSISPREEYNLPIQTNHRMFLWHEDYGSPYLMNFITDQDFLGSGVNRDDIGTPTVYRMWGYDMILEQPTQASVVSVSSSSSTDTSIGITIFGIVSGYPDFEVISTNSSNGTTASPGTKSFSSIERIVKGASTVGRITATSNAGNVTLSVIPTGDSTIGINYSKIKLYPLPDSVFTMNVNYYKETYDLVNSGDVHELGGDFDEAIILLATSKIDYETNKLEGDRFFQLYRNEIKNLRKINVDKIDWFPKLMKSRNTRNRDHLVHPFLSKRQFGSNF